MIHQNYFLTKVRNKGSSKDELHIYSRDGKLISKIHTTGGFDADTGSIFSSDEKYVLLRMNQPPLFTKGKTTMRVVDVNSGKIVVPEYETTNYAVWWNKN